MAQRSTHTCHLPAGLWCPDYLVQLFRDHGCQAFWDGNRIEVTLRFGRVYEVVRKSGRKGGWRWEYRVTVDPTSGIDEIRRSQRAEVDLLSYLEVKDSTPRAWWWDGELILTGRFLALDLETTPAMDGELPEVVLGSAADDTGTAVLLEPGQITDFILKHLEACPEQVFCNWNLAGFDLPVLCYRLPGFRERVYERLIKRLYRGYVYDTMLMVQLRDIALYGMLFSPDSAALGSWHEPGSRSVYTLGMQAKRFLGVELAKAETLLFWEYLGRPREIPSDLGSYALEDVIAVAAIQADLHNDLEVWRIADRTRAEMEYLKGVVLERSDGVKYEPLLDRTNAYYGWQTHTIQFLGAVALSWSSTAGVEVDVEHTFGVIKELEEKLLHKLWWFGGRPGRPIWKVERGLRTEVSWVPDDYGDAGVEEELERLRKETEDDADITFEAGESTRFEVRDRTKVYGEQRLVDLKTDDKVFRFVNQRSVNEKAIHAYVKAEMPQLRRHLADGEKLDEREAERIGLQTKQWMVKFGVDDVDAIPDLVLRTKFQIAGLKKRIATVKSYLPGFATHPQRKSLQNVLADELRRILKLEGIKTGRVFPHFKTLVATGRTGAFDPNLQQVERSGKMRGCFISAAGCILIISDFGAAEMVTQAEIYRHRYPDIPWERSLASYLNAGFDPHILTGMKVRFGDEFDVWWPICSDPYIRAIKRAMTPADRRQAILELQEQRDEDGNPIPAYEKLDPDTSEAGEDVAKGLWVPLMAEALTRHEIAQTGKRLTVKEFEDRVGKIKGEIKKARQAAKPLNFGIPGGMLPPRIVSYAQTDYGVKMELADAQKAYDAWLEMYPEGRCWLERERQARYLRTKPTFPYPPHYEGCFTLTGRLRGSLETSMKSEEGEEPGYDPGWNEWHNTQFQGQAADAAKLATYYVWHEGVTTNNFVHDELDVESPEAVAPEQREIITSSMRQGMDDVTHYLEVTVGSETMNRWRK